MLLPLLLLVLLLYYIYFSKNPNKKKMSIVSAMILGLFIGLFFEDRYLTGFGGFNTAAIVWVLSMAMFQIVNRKRLTNKK